MRARSNKSSSATANSSEIGEKNDVSDANEGLRSDDDIETTKAKRSIYVIFALLILIVYGSWAVYHYQFDGLPMVLTAEQAGKRGFSEEETVKHVKALTELGPHSVGSDALDEALQYVLAIAENIKKMAHWEVEVEVDFFNAKTGANRLIGGRFKGKTLIYSDLKHVVLRILPKYAPEAGENAILVSSHIDTVFSGEGAGDCSSCVSVMLELARGLSHWAHGFKNAVIFLFNTGEEEGLNGAHSFVTQHPWRDTLRMAIDLEAMGIGGKSAIFQAGPHPWAIENYAEVAKYPSAQIIAQDVFSSGAINSATDFQVYQEVAGLSGLDFAYLDRTAVYHTKNDKLEFLKPGSLQHLGENMLAFLRQAASSDLPKDMATETKDNSSHDTAIYFDVLGSYMIVFHQSLASMLYNSVIIQSLLIWAVSLLVGGYTSVISLALSFLSVIFMWIFSLSFSALVAFILPHLSSSPVPFISCPWLVIGLFAAPALLGAFVGQHLGYIILRKYLSSISLKKTRNLSSVTRTDLAKLDAERWIFKAGLLQWLAILMVGNYYKIGSSYLALVWLVSPAVAYGLLEATLSPTQLPRPLKTVTLLIGLSIPFLISSGMFIRLAATVIGNAVRFESNPGSTPEWMGNVIMAVYCAAAICLTLVYLLSYIHISGPRTYIIVATSILFGASIAAVSSGVIPPFTEDTVRAVNVVHVVDRTGLYGQNQEPNSYISLFSATPGKLTKEVGEIGEDFVCGNDKVLDFVTFSAKYSCFSHNDVESGWSKLDIPTISVESDIKGDERITYVEIDTKVSTRWALAINTDEIEDFVLKVNSEELIPLGNKTSSNGWHIIQFAGGKNAPKKFDLSLFWSKNRSQKTQNNSNQNQTQVLKLRTDLDISTPQFQKVMSKLPRWCSLFGKSTSPHKLAFLIDLPSSF